MAHCPRHCGCPLGNIGELFGGRALVDGRVGHEDRVRLADEDVDAEGYAPLGGVDNTAHFAHRLRIGPCRAGDHRVGLTHLEHQRSEDVAILIDHPLDFAAKITAPLQAFVQPIDHRGHEWRVTAVVHFEVLRIVDAQRRQPLVNVIAPDQNRNAIATVAELNRRAQHDLLLALGEDDAFGMRARALIGEAQDRIRWVEAAAQRVAIFVHVEDWARRDA